MGFLGWTQDIHLCFIINLPYIPIWIFKPNRLEDSSLVVFHDVLLLQTEKEYQNKIQWLAHYSSNLNLYIPKNKKKTKVLTCNREHRVTTVLRQFKVPYAKLLKDFSFLNSTILYMQMRWVHENIRKNLRFCEGETH